MGTSARERILARIRNAYEARNLDPVKIAAEAAALLPPDGIIQPSFENLTNQQKFVERLISERLTATVDYIDEWDGMVAAVHRYCTGQGIPLRLAVPDHDCFTGRAWGEISIHHDIALDERAVLECADYGIAETGTLVFTSRPDNPTLFHYLGLHHIVLIESKAVLRYMEDYWRLVRKNGNKHPRNINFITGTSGTADIEAQNIRGAHGPRFLHVIIVGGAA